MEVRVKIAWFQITQNLNNLKWTLEFHFDQKWTFYIWILNFHTEVNCEVSINYSTVNVRNTRSCQFYRHNFSHSWMVLWLISSNFLHAARLLLFFSLAICKMIIGASSGTSWETININEWRASSSRVHVTPSFFFCSKCQEKPTATLSNFMNDDFFVYYSGS